MNSKINTIYKPKCISINHDEKTYDLYTYFHPSLEKVVLFIRALDDAYMLTNLHTLLLPKCIRKCNYVIDNGIANYAKINILAQEDVLPSIPNLKGLPHWKSSWKELLMNIYDYIYGSNLNASEAFKTWENDATNFLFSIHKYFPVTNDMLFYREILVEHMKFLYNCREKIYNGYYSEVLKNILENLKNAGYKKIFLVTHHWGAEVLNNLFQMFPDTYCDGIYIVNPLLNQASSLPKCWIDYVFSLQNDQERFSQAKHNVLSHKERCIYKDNRYIFTNYNKDTPLRFKTFLEKHN